MATWVIETENQAKQKETKLRAKLGDVSYDDRVAVANEKAEELNWEAEMFMAPHFKTFATECSEEIFDKVRHKSGDFWYLNQLRPYRS